MNIANEKVNHIKFGSGVITEVGEHKILVQFQDNVGVKAFLYPEAFEKFLEVVNPEVQNSILEKLHIKQEQLSAELELKRKKEEQEKEELQKVELEQKKLSLAEKRTAAKLSKIKASK